MANIYEKSISVIGEQYNYIDIRLSYDRKYYCYEPAGVYTLFVAPVFRETCAAGLCSTTYGLCTGYKLEVHTCTRQTKKQDREAIEKIHGKFDYMRIVNLLLDEYNLTLA